MKRADLTDLGLSNEQVSAVMKMHGQSMNKFADYDELKAQNEQLTSQISERDKSLSDLKKQVKDNGDLTSKIESLQKANKDLKANSDKEIAHIKLDSAVNSALSGAHVRNNKAAKALLDMDKVELDDKGNLTGLDEQLQGLKKDNAWMFDQGSKTNYEPNGGDGSGGESLQNQFFDAFGVKNNKGD